MDGTSSLDHSGASVWFHARGGPTDIRPGREGQRSRTARQEAFERLGGRYDVRVLEPSPPAVTDPPYLADDPVEGGEVVPLERPGTTSWSRLCAQMGDAALDAWCADRWLGPWRRLEPLPPRFTRTRQALHAVAEHVLAPARHAANGKIGLRYTWRGFGTPFFPGRDGADRQVRLEGADLVDGSEHTPLTTLGEACAAAGVAPGTRTGVYEPATHPAFDRPLDVEAAPALAEWFGFCASVLEQLREEAADAGRVQLWPEHFDLATDLGDEAAGRRANYGGSPGDDQHPEPYLYVGPWAPAEGGFWNEPFGASLSYRDLLTADDQRETALGFLRHGRQLLEAR